MIVSSNTGVESFLHTLETKRTHEKRYSSREEAKSDVIEYIEMFNNSCRLYSILGFAAYLCVHLYWTT